MPAVHPFPENELTVARYGRNDTGPNRQTPGPPSGRLRINGPTPALEFRLDPLLASFVAEHPHVQLELIADERLIDIVDAGFDAGVRYGENLIQDVVAISLGQPQRMIVVGSPAYLAAKGVPADPADCIASVALRRCFRTATSCRGRLWSTDARFHSRRRDQSWRTRAGCNC